jgi:hypothetical protein
LRRPRVTKGEITKFSSSPGVQRGFCARCGSTLTCESERLPAKTHFHVGASDQAERLQPMRHIFPEERLPWLHLTRIFTLSERDQRKGSKRRGRDSLPLAAAAANADEQHHHGRAEQ